MNRQERRKLRVPPPNPNINKNHIVKPTDDPLNAEGHVVFPALMLPAFRNTLAVEKGVQNNLLISTYGGLGDVICAEPTIRFALENFKDVEISVITDYPQLFRHLKLKNLFDANFDKPDFNEYYVFHTMFPGNHIQMDFMSPLLTHCVEYMCLCAFRCQMPPEYKKLKLVPTQTDFERVANMKMDSSVVIHAGRHWQSNTMPDWWWNGIIGGLRARGITPILVGKDVVDIRGTVEVNTEGCIDLRNQLKVMETIALMQSAKVVLTNDSSPLHMAASGDAWIGFMATAKRSDLITHWRGPRNEFGYKMKNFSLGGAWEIFDFCPNKTKEVTVNDVGEKLLGWLPEPEVVSEWAAQKLASELLQGRELMGN